MLVREHFTTRLDELIGHFGAHGFGYETVVVQLMNDFPRWLPDEMRLVASRTEVILQRIEALYLRSYRVIREVRLDEQKHSPLKHHQNSKPGFIKEIEGQAWDSAKNANPFGGARNSTGTSSSGDPNDYDEWVQMYSQHFQGSLDADTLERLRRMHANRRGSAEPNPRHQTEEDRRKQADYNASSIDEMLRRMRGNSQGTKKTFDTKRPWQAAPAYLHFHFEVMEMPYPISIDEAKKKYRELAMKTHPDRNGGNDEAFKKILTSWERIKEFLEKSA